MGHWALGIEHWALGMGHGAWSMGHGAWCIGSSPLSPLASPAPSSPPLPQNDD
ncbi:MAG: hypothetical protein HWQ41_32835 [Nostoc sp. NOS(2021)]|uniref:hypothetical protein n=1 Tax=Nostoc sp. NOS(2021) TaxID=2815407 RepID=UPI0025ED2221|nr:hypothetical protein [Nostoc sp. NOS(2021)]MBN3899883.1 hypothetical protein [Nostoc sp. NOS(2021)]